jgi:hypothetical protein
MIKIFKKIDLTILKKITENLDPINRVVALIRNGTARLDKTQKRKPTSELAGPTISFSRRAENEHKKKKKKKEKKTKPEDKTKIARENEER